MPQLENIEAIEKRLWGAADTLRANSNYASNQYFMPVMGLVFLRHAYIASLSILSIICPFPKWFAIDISGDRLLIQPFSFALIVLP